MIHIQKFNSASDCLEAQRGFLSEILVVTMSDFQKVLFQRLFYLCLVHKYNNDEETESTINKFKDGGYDPRIMNESFIVLGDGEYFVINYKENDFIFFDEISNDYADELMDINDITWVFEQAYETVFETVGNIDLSDPKSAEKWLTENGLRIFSNDKSLADKLLEIYLKK